MTLLAALAALLDNGPDPSRDAVVTAVLYAAVAALVTRGALRGSTLATIVGGLWLSMAALAGLLALTVRDGGPWADDVLHLTLWTGAAVAMLVYAYSRYFVWRSRHRSHLVLDPPAVRVVAVAAAAGFLIGLHGEADDRHDHLPRAEVHAQVNRMVFDAEPRLQPAMSARGPASSQSERDLRRGARHFLSGFGPLVPVDIYPRADPFDDQDTRSPSVTVWVRDRRHDVGPFRFCITAVDERRWAVRSRCGR